jgi:hypothetical protein
MRRIPQPIRMKRLGVIALRITENSSCRVSSDQNQEMTGRSALESISPTETGIRTEIRMPHRWIAAAKKPHITHPIR